MCQRVYSAYQREREREEEKFLKNWFTQLWGLASLKCAMQDKGLEIPAGVSVIVLSLEAEFLPLC